jgi:hypothetical protein
LGDSPPHHYNAGMDRPRLYRVLRFTFTTVCGTLCALFVVLWARGYWKWDALHLSHANSQRMTLGSNSGTFYLTRTNRPAAMPAGWTFKSSEALQTPKKFRWRSVGDIAVIVIPCWATIFITAALAAAPWMKPQFGLRTVLIATATIAALLALIMRSI